MVSLCTIDYHQSILTLTLFFKVLWFSVMWQICADGYIIVCDILHPPIHKLYENSHLSFIKLIKVGKGYKNEESCLIEWFYDSITCPQVMEVQESLH